MPSTCRAFSLPLDAVQPHEQEVFDELARDVAAAKAKQGREVIPDDTEGGMWPFGEGGLERDDDGDSIPPPDPARPS